MRTIHVGVQPDDIGFCVTFTSGPRRTIAASGLSEQEAQKQADVIEKALTEAYQQGWTSGVNEGLKHT